MIVPDRFEALDGALKVSHTLRGIHISSRTGLAYCEIAAGASGRQKTWWPAALYYPPLTDRAHFRATDTEDMQGWRIVGEVRPRLYHGQFNVFARRSFNPGQPLKANIIVNAQSDGQVLMQHILEKWYG